MQSGSWVGETKCGLKPNSCLERQYINIDYSQKVCPSRVTFIRPHDCSEVVIIMCLTGYTKHCSGSGGSVAAYCFLGKDKHERRVFAGGRQQRAGCASGEWVRKHDRWLKASVQVREGNRR